MDETTDGYADSTPERQAELIRAAVALTQAGFAVVPIPRKGIEYTNAKGEKSLTTGKGPMLPGWQTERIPISKLSRELSNPKYSGIGIISGTLSGDVICLDFDGLNWEYAYQAIIDALVILAKTLQAYTGSGRIHIYIRCPDMPKDFTRLVFRRDDAVIELRGNMMQAVAPPSIHPETGNPYEWVDEDAEIVELPFQTILDVLNAWAPVNAPESAAGEGMRIERGDARLPVTGRTRDFLANGAPGGEQRTRACGATRNLLSSGMPAEQVLEAIWEGLQRCPQTGPDPWTRQDAEKLVTSIARSVEPPAPQYLLDPQPVVLNVGKGKESHIRAEGNTLVDRPPDNLNTDAYPAFPYYIERGKTIYYKIQGGGDSRKGEPHDVAEFHATITTDAATEQGDHLWTIEGKTASGRTFETEIDSRKFGDARALKSVLVSAAGPTAPVNAGQDAHLGPAIQRFTAAYGNVHHIMQYERIGWQTGECGRFLIPGHRDDNDTRIRLLHDLPFEFTDGDLAKGREALSYLLMAKPRAFTLPLFAAMMGPAAARICGWDNERYVTFSTGQTGSYKTAVSSCFMTLWGPRWIHDVNLAKWGEGSTSNALLRKSTYASDAPFFIDNFKPGTGGGAKAFTALTHNMIEGSEKSRLDRDSRLRAAKEIHAWPICTGEDTPGHDPATLARMLVLSSERDTTNTDALTRAQDASEHLNAIGRAWIEWLESTAGRSACGIASKAFRERRTKWRDFMQKTCPDPHGRIASTLAVNELVGRLLAECPATAQVWREADQCLGTDGAHVQGLKVAGGQMAGAAVEAAECSRFLQLLGELLSTGTVLVAPKGKSLADYALTPTGSYTASYQPDRMIGWKDEQGYYLLPDRTREIVMDHDANRLNGISGVTLHKQLYAGGFIAGHDADKLTKNIRDGGTGQQRVLWLTLEAVTGPRMPDEEAENA